MTVEAAPASAAANAVAERAATRPIPTRARLRRYLGWLKVVPVVLVVAPHEVLVDVLLAQVPARLAIGHRADVHLALERRPNVARLPLAFLRRDAAGVFAFADDAGRIARVPVQTGVVGRDFVEVASGLKPGHAVLDAPTPGGALTAGRRWAAAP